MLSSTHADKGWRDLVATERSALADAWDTLTKQPALVTELCYPLRGTAGQITRAGAEHTLWQLKLNKRSGARIWYYLDNRVVYIEKVFTSHPNATK